MHSLILTFNVNNNDILNIDTLLHTFDISQYDIIILNLQEALFVNDKTAILTSEIFTMHKISMGFIKTVVLSKSDNMNIKQHNFPLGPMWFINKGFLITQVDDIININVHFVHNSEKKRVKQVEKLKKVLENNNISGKIIISGDFNFRNNFTESEKMMEIFNGGNKEICLMEHKISFTPTYKYLRGMNEYDNRRIPAYTDRIFCTSGIKIRKYNSIKNEICSDHRPVYMDCDIEDINNGYRKKIEISNKYFIYLLSVLYVAVMENKHEEQLIVLIIMIFLTLLFSS